MADTDIITCYLVYKNFVVRVWHVHLNDCLLQGPTDYQVSNKYDMDWIGWLPTYTYFWDPVNCNREFLCTKS